MQTVTLVRDLGPSPDGHAEQIEVLSNVSQGNSPAVTNLVDGLRSAISRASPPSGLSVHLAGAIPIAVDQQKQTGNTGNQIQGLSVLFIIVLLLLIFRAALAPLITLSRRSWPSRSPARWSPRPPRPGSRSPSWPRSCSSCWSWARARTTGCSWCSGSASSCAAGWSPRRR